MFKRVADALIHADRRQAAAAGARRALEALAERARDELQKVSTFTGQVQRAGRAVQAVHDRPRHRVPLRQHARAVGARDAGRSGQAAVGAAPDRLARVLARHPLPRPPEVDVRQARRGVRREAEERSTRTRSWSSCSRRRSSSTATARRCACCRKRRGRPSRSTYTYGQIGELAWQGAGVLRQLGVGATAIA